MSPKTGRPPKCDGGSKKERLEIRVNDAQMALIDELAEKYGINRTEVILKAVALLAEQV